MNKKVCIVGKGSSLLLHNVANLIDSHDVIIRVNHLPDESNFNIVGCKTHIFSTRSPDKLSKYIDKLNTCDIWICSDLVDKYKKFDMNLLKLLTTNEMLYMQKYFSNFMNLNLHPNNTLKNMVMPDAGINTILLALLRFPECTINVCGVDMYQNGNISIDDIKKNSSNFMTPVFQQMLFYKMLIRNKMIHQI